MSLSLFANAFGSLLWARYSSYCTSSRHSTRCHSDMTEIRWKEASVPGFNRF